MVKNQYFTKDYVSTALLHQHNIFVSNKSIKLVSNFNGVDLVLVQKVYDGNLRIHTFIVFDDIWLSNDKLLINNFTLKELV